MTLASAWILHFLWLLPLAGFMLIVRQRRRRRALRRFAEPPLLARLTPADHKGQRFIKGLLLLAALGLLVAALAGPRWGSRFQQVSRKGVDIMLLVDVSRSMMVEDIKPNRLERARREIVDFLKVVDGDRVGLTVFAGAAFVQCPLTLDYAALEMFLGSLQPGSIPVPGTDLGAAVETALAAFDFKTTTDKVMLLITDGEDNERRGVEAAREAAARNVKLFVFGIGDPSGGPIPAADGQGGFKKDKDGNLVLSKLDEKTLQELAAVTGGDYTRSEAGDLDLDVLYFEGVKHKTRAQVLKSGKIIIHEERFYLFVLAALLLLLAEGLLGGKRRPAMKKRFGLLGLILAVGLVHATAPSSSLAAESPDALYRQGRFAEAEKAYARADMDHPKTLRHRYNRGCAAFKNEQYQEAAAAFTSVLRRTRDDTLRFKAAYNLGNTAFKQNDFAAAVNYYKQALGYDPADADARHNLEMALRARANQKQPPPQKQPQQPGQDAPRDEDGKQSDQNRDTPPAKPQGPPDQKTAGAGDRPQDKGQTGQERSQPQKSRPDSTEEKTGGELTPRQPPTAMPRAPEEQGQTNAGTDKKKAEALLDNIRENPAQIMRFMLPDKKRGAGSERDW